MRELTTAEMGMVAGGSGGQEGRDHAKDAMQGGIVTAVAVAANQCPKSPWQVSALCVGGLALAGFYGLIGVEELREGDSSESQGSEEKKSGSHPFNSDIYQFAPPWITDPDNHRPPPGYPSTYQASSNNLNFSG